MDRPATFFSALFDFSFKSFITSKIIRVLYFLSIAGAALWSLRLIVGGFQESAGAGLLMLLIGGPLAFLVVVIYARVLLEIILVVFRISDNISKLTEMGGRTPPPPPAPPHTPETGHRPPPEAGPPGL